MINELPKYNPLPEEPCLTEDQLYGYIDGKLTPAGQHAVEKHLLDCALCSDALDGLQLVKNRNKVAFVPPAVPAEDKKETTAGNENKGKIILLFTRRQYAAAAAIVVLVAVAWFLRGNLTSEEKTTADNQSAAVAADSMKSGDSLQKAKSTASPREEENGKVAFTSPEVSTTDASTADGVAAGTDIPVSGNTDGDRVVEDAAPVMQDVVTVNAEEDKKLDQQEKAKIPADEKADDKEGYYKDAAKNTSPQKLAGTTNKQERALFEKKNNNKMIDFGGKAKMKSRKASAAYAYGQPKTNADQSNRSSSSDYRDTQKAGFANTLSKTTESKFELAQDSVSAITTTGGSTTLTSPAGGAYNYTWTPPATNNAVGATGLNSSTYFVTVTDANGATFADSGSRNSPVKDIGPTEAQQYDQGMRFVQSNLLQAAIASFDEVLKKTSNAHYEDAQWQKSIALLKLNKKAEAKILLDAIVQKGGKYKSLAEAQLKQL